ncbi:C1 family peptidase [Sulfitobacter sp. MF3-043]|uniref:C1 family peptidase n=1 Tax=Sulfitobacter sediminivivens TaxID=3252902 RepID=UPI0036DDFF16
MAQRRYVFGGGVPAGWSSSITIDFMKGAGISRNDSFFKDKDLLGTLISTNNWPVRDQGTRGTCNAFAVAAAEELLGHNMSGALKNLSEEYLYGKMQGYGLDPLRDIGVNLSDIDEQALAESGGTFLEQARMTLIKNGLCSEASVEYQSNAATNHFETVFPEPAEIEASSSKIAEGKLAHDIVQRPKPAKLNPWLRSSTEQPISEVLAEKIQSGLPAAASFAILSGTGKQAWTGRRARHLGKVEYPSDTVARELTAIGGHSVCLVGFIASNDENTLHKGWFVFRNSYGEDGFAKSFHKDDTQPVVPAAGYGLISTHDVDRYCWEYLARTSGGSGQPVF